MANNYRLKGSTDLSATAYWSTGAYPIDAADVKFMEGADSFATSGMDLSVAGTVNLTSLTFERTFGDQSCKIGVSGTPLKAKVNQATSKTKLWGTFGEVNIGGVYDHANFNWAPVNPSANLLVDEILPALTILEGGKSTLGTNIVFGASGIYIFGGTHTLVKHVGNTNVPNIWLYGGTLICQRDWTAIVQGGGKLVVELDTGATGGTITQHGGTIEWHFGDAGNLTLLNGEIDRTKMQKIPTVGTVAIYPGMTERFPGTTGSDWTTGTRTEYGTGPTKIAV